MTIRGIDLVAPLVSFTPGDAFAVLSRTAALQGNQVLLQQFAVDLMVAVGLSAQNTAGLVVEDCRFSLDFTQLHVAANIFAAGILASGSLSETAVTGCTFATSPIPSSVPFYDLAIADPATDDRPSPPYRLTFGYLQVPATTSEGGRALESAATVSVLHDASIEGCRFLGVTVPAVVMAQLGTVRLDNNIVQDCYAGFWLFALANSAQSTAFELVPASNAATNSELAAIGLSVLGNGILVLALAMARVLPTTPPTGAAATARVIAPLDEATLSAAAQGLRSLLTQAVSNLAPAAAAGTAAPATGLVGHLVADVHRLLAGGQPTVAAAAAAQPAPTPGPAVTPATAGSPPAARTDLVSALLPALDNVLANVGAAALQVPPAVDLGITPVLRLGLAGNQVDAVVASSYSGPGLLVFDATSAFGSILLTGNRISNRFPDGQAAAVYTVDDAAAINGNIIANEVATRTDLTVAAPTAPAATTAAATTTTTCSLFFQETVHEDQLPVAIVGNVFVHTPILLPIRLQQRWLNLNAVSL